MCLYLNPLYYQGHFIGFTRRHKPEQSRSWTLNTPVQHSSSVLHSDPTFPRTHRPSSQGIWGEGDCGNWALTVLQWLSELQLSNRLLALTHTETHEHTQTCTHMRVGLTLLPQGFKRNVRYFPSCKWYSIIPLILSLSPIYTGMYPHKPRKYHSNHTDTFTSRSLTWASKNQFVCKSEKLYSLKQKILKMLCCNAAVIL